MATERDVDSGTDGGGAARGDRYANASLECDLIMKGGVTSGIIYPLAVCELAETYRLRCIGGASAGAIAAAFAAAAEHGRGADGFGKLELMPDDMAAPPKGRPRGATQLLRLFQPEGKTERLFRVVMAVLRKGGGLAAGLLAAVAAYPFWPLVGMLLGAAVVAAAVLTGGAVTIVLGVVAAAALAAGIAALGVFAQAKRDVLGELPDNGFGICRGMHDGLVDEDDPPLTQWLYERINDVAGLPKDGDPLTFGDLWGDVHAGGEPRIDLQVMTTDLTAGLPRRMPWASRRYYFREDEFREWFPPQVVGWMADRSRDTMRPESDPPGATWRHVPAGYLRLPDAADLPVVVATRMSLSFPVLLSAVPLYAVDFDDPHNRAVKAALRAQARNGTPLPEDLVPEYSLTKCWFSDGGICSNFPVHLFDAPLPRRPTFAMNLRQRGGVEGGKPIPEAEKVFLPSDNRETRMSPWTGFAEDGEGRLRQFAWAILDTMQNWVDNSQLTLPGVADRVVHIYHDDAEGGMNLDMTPDTMQVLARRGRLGARLLVDQFVGERAGKGPAWGWRNHRWVRYRTAAAGLETWLGDFRRRYDGELTSIPPGYDELFADQPSYRFSPARKAADAQGQTRELDDLVAGWKPGTFNDEGCPKSPPRLRLMPTQPDAAARELSEQPAEEGADPPADAGVDPAAEARPEPEAPAAG